MYRRARRFFKTKRGKRVALAGAVVGGALALRYAPGPVKAFVARAAVTAARPYVTSLARRAGSKMLGGRFFGNVVRKSSRYASVDPWSKDYIAEYSKQRFGKYY